MESDGKSMVFQCNLANKKQNILMEVACNVFLLNNINNIHSQCALFYLLILK